jgi:hypothetical protein
MMMDHATHDDDHSSLPLSLPPPPITCRKEEIRTKEKRWGRE